jgi:predicted RNase H-like nuclease (RuvC/YqgF family)
MSQDINTKEIYECEECRQKDGLVAEMQEAVASYSDDWKKWKIQLEEKDQKIAELVKVIGKQQSEIEELKIKLEEK